MANIARLGVVLGIDTTEFTKGLNAAKKSLNDFSAKIPTLAAVGAAAFSAMAYKALEFADQISDTAKANDVAIESILKLSSSLQLAGGKGEDAGKLLSKFNTVIDEAAQGSKSAQESFGRIGISLRDLGKLSSEDLFNKSIQQLAKVEDVAQRTGLAVQLFGKAIKGVDIKELADQLSKGSEEYKKYAEAIRIAGDLQDQLDAKAKKTLILFTNTFIPTINTLFESMNKSGSAFESFMEFGGEAFKGLIYGGRTLVTVFQTINAAVNLTALSLKALVTGAAQDIPKLIKEYDEYVANLRKGDKEFAKKLMTPPKAKDSSKDAFAGRTILNPDDEAVKKAQALSIEYAMQSYLKFEQLKRQRELVEMTTNEKAVAEAIYKIEDDRFNKILDLEKQITAEKAKNKPNKTLIEELENQIKVINGVADAYKRLTEEELLAQQQAQRTFEFGWNKAFRQYAEDATNYAKMAGDMFKSVTQSMEDAIVKFVTTGKLSFRDFAQSIIAEIIKIQARSIAAQTSSSILGSIPWSSMFGNVGTALQFGTNIGSQQTAMLAAQGFADGGSPPVGVPSLVGERGPELFVPSRSGTIIPNNQLSSALGGSTIVNNYNINAIDTKSFEDRLYGSANAVWAANQYAGNKNLATSRSRA